MQYKGCLRASSLCSPATQFAAPVLKTAATNCKGTTAEQLWVYSVFKPGILPQRIAAYPLPTTGMWADIAHTPTMEQFSSVVVEERISGH